MRSVSRVAALLAAVTGAMSPLAFATTPSRVHVDFELNLSASGD